uniref:Uncharacterized protein n=1 Tax=Periophthalmus magnuspinnatus TaxID=409849 RepID=A0A3B4A9N1_9GOBI
VLAGNKVDLVEEREVSVGEGRALAEDWGCPFMETSAKSKTMVDELFFSVFLISTFGCGVTVSCWSRCSACLSE